MGSAYMIMYSEKLYKLFKPLLKRFEKKVGKQESLKSINTNGEIIVF